MNCESNHSATPVFLREFAVVFSFVYFVPFVVIMISSATSSAPI